MGTYKLKRFSHPEGLKAIEKDHLMTLLSPFGDFFDARGVTLPATGSADGLDYEGLVKVFMNPDTDTPKELVDALYYIHEMSTPEGMDELLDEAEKFGVQLDDGTDHSPADVAVQAWLQNKDFIERKHAQQYLTRPRSFEYFQTDKSPIPEFEHPSPQALTALQNELDDWFEQKKRGRDSRVFVYPKDAEIWFLVRHGEPLKREGSLEKGESSSVFYRPEKFDVLVYELASGELRMNARSKGEKELYRKKFGLHLFGDEDFFPGTGKYTLEPLRVVGEKSLVCTDIDGMEWVKLREVYFYWGGPHGEIEVRKADDIFAALQARGRSMPSKARIIRASFQVKFVDSKTPRTVTIRPSNIAQYTRDDDSMIIEKWLLERGFIVTDRQEEDEEATASLASA